MANQDITALESANQKYRETLVKNEGLLSKQNKELREAVKRMQVAKTDKQRL